MEQEGTAANSSGANPAAKGGPSQPVVPTCQSFPNVMPNIPTMYSFLVPAFVPSQHKEENDSGAGIYAVPVHPFTGTADGSGLISLTYNIPTRSNSTEDASLEHGQAAREQQAPPRQDAVRRFRFAFVLDYFLILKLLAVVILFNQDGSRQRLISLLLFAILVYLHQTGALAPLLRWLRQQATPPQAHVPVRAENDPPIGDANRNAPQAAAGAENQNQHPDNEGGRAGNEIQVIAEGVNGANWWGIVKEIQMFVIGFITSLLPGIHQHND